MQGTDLFAAITAVATAVAAVVAAVAVVVGFRAAKRDRLVTINIHKSEQSIQRLLALQPLLAAFDRLAAARRGSRRRDSNDDPAVRNLQAEFAGLLRGSIEDLPATRSMVFDHIPKEYTAEAMDRFRTALVGEEAGNGENSSPDEMFVRAEILYVMHGLREQMLASVVDNGTKTARAPL